MGFTTFYNGKVIEVPVTAGNNSTISNVENVIITFTVPQGLRYSGSDLPQGTFDIENNIWEVGTLSPNTSVEAIIYFIAVDSDIYIGEELNISWTISSIDVNPDFISTNNTQTYNILPINCNQIEDCLGCASLPIFYECKKFTIYAHVINNTTDIQEDIRVDFVIPDNLGLKTAIPTYGTATLGEDIEGNLSSFNISDNACPGIYYNHLVWRIPTLPALAIAEVALTFYILGPINNCEKIEWEITHEVEGSVLHGLRNRYLLRGVEGYDLETSLGYKEWSGKLIYSTLPISTPLGYATGYIALPYNRGSLNYLGDLDLNFVGPGQFNLLGNNTFFTSKVVLLKGGHGATSEDIAITTRVDEDNLDFTTNGLVDEIDNDVVIRVYY